MSTPEAICRIQQSFKEASQKRVLDQVTSDDSLAFCSQLLRPLQSARSKIPTKSVEKHTTRASKKGPPDSDSHIPPKAATHATTRKKRAVVKPRNHEHTSSTSAEDASITAGRSVVESPSLGAAAPSKGPHPSSVSYNFLDMNLAGDRLGASITASSTHTKEAQPPLTTPHPHPHSAGGSQLLSETSGAFFQPQRAEGMTQDHCTPTTTLPKAYDILADEIVSAMVGAHSRGGKGSTGRSSRHQTPEVRTHTHAHMHVRTHSTHTTHTLQAHTNGHTHNTHTHTLMDTHTHKWTHTHTHGLDTILITYLALNLLPCPAAPRHSRPCVSPRDRRLHNQGQASQDTSDLQPTPTPNWYCHSAVQHSCPVTRVPQCVSVLGCSLCTIHGVCMYVRLAETRGCCKTQEVALVLCGCRCLQPYLLQKSYSCQ